MHQREAELLDAAVDGVRHVLPLRDVRSVGFQSFYVVEKTPYAVAVALLNYLKV